MSFSQNHNNIFNNVKFATCFGYSNHHQADISVYGQDMFSAYSMGSNIVYICYVEFQTFRLIYCSMFNILTNVFSEIIYGAVFPVIPSVGHCGVARLQMKSRHMDGMHCIIDGTSILVKIKSVALYNCQTVYIS